MSTELVKFDPLKTEVAKFVAPAMKVIVEDQETNSRALTISRELKGLEKRVEEVRKTLKDPIIAQGKAIDDYAKTIQAPLTQALNHIKKELVSYEAKMEKERAAALKKAEEERIAKEKALAAEKAAEKTDSIQDLFKTDDEKARDQISSHVQNELATKQIERDHRQAIKAVEATKLSGARKVWVFEVVDPTLVPVEFKTVDERKIRQAVNDGTRSIPGVIIKEELKVAIRS